MANKRNDTNPQNMFGVLRRIVPPHGIKVGCTTEEVANSLTRGQADELANRLQARNPGEEYAVVECVFRRWTKGGED